MCIRDSRNVVVTEGPSDLASIVAEEASAGAYVMCLGAGNISAWANALPDELAALGDG